MKLILGIILLLAPVILCKESVDDLVQLLEDPEILQEIVKRLGSENHEKSVDDVDSCKYNNFTKTIIQTKASTAAGAAYLDSQVGVVSNLECVNKCCHLDGCELAVYENKKERNCYLFRCKDVKTDENYCQFASHDDYISTSVTHNIEVSHDHDSNVNDHENDLQGLSDKVTTTTTTTETPEQPHSVSVGGKCRHPNACEDSHAYCLNGVCSCVTSYYNKQGTCREVCGPSRFECRVVDLDGPDCVRRSLVCDGSSDCYDGSDEVNCQKHAPIPKLPWFNNQIGFGSNFDSKLMHHSDKGTENSLEQKTPVGITLSPAVAVDSAAIAREYHQKDSPIENSQSQELDSDIKDIKNVKPINRPESISPDMSNAPVEKAKKNEETPVQAEQSPTQQSNPVVIWPDNSPDNSPSNLDNQDQTPDSPDTFPHHYHEEVPTETFIPVSRLSSQGKKGPSYFVANKPKPESNAPKKMEVEIVGKPKLIQTQRPHPVHDAHMVSAHHPENQIESNNMNRPPVNQPNLQPNIQQTKFLNNQNAPEFENYYQPPFHQQQYPADLSLSEPGQGDITPFNRNYKPYERPVQPQPQLTPYTNYRGYQNNKLSPQRNPYVPSYKNNFLYDYPEYESYQADSDESGNPDRPDRPYIPGTMKNTKPIDTHFTHEKDIKHIDDDNVTSNSKITDTKTSKGKDGTIPDKSTSHKIDTLKSKSHDKSKPVDTSNSHETSKSHDTSKSDETSKSDDTDSLHNKDKSKESKEDTSDENKSNDVTFDTQKLAVSTSKPSPDHTGISKPAEINIQENHESLVVTKEKVYLTESFKMAQGPIIALSLGLAFTFLLLVFIGCRLRNIKRRLRKGRILHSNEADYLINGMYL